MKEVIKSENNANIKRLKEILQNVEGSDFVITNVLLAKIYVEENLKPLHLLEIPLGPAVGFEKEQGKMNILVEELIGVLKEFGFKVSRGWQVPEYNGVYDEVTQHLIIGKEQKKISEFLSVWQKRLLDQDTSKEVDKQLGLMLGYPKTAVKAFVGEPGYTKIVVCQLPKSIQQKDYMAFTEFTFSKEYLDDELDVVKQWAEIVKKESPKLYMKKVKEYQDKLEREIG